VVRWTEQNDPVHAAWIKAGKGLRSDPPREDVPCVGRNKGDRVASRRARSIKQGNHLGSQLIGFAWVEGAGRCRRAV
jgi:hypothetical protein